MGTLDDAIREHLELKRRLGASDEELERQEAEALGRRSPAPEQPAAAPSPPPEPGPQAVPGEPDSEAEVIDQPDLPAIDPGRGRNGASATIEPPADEPEPAQGAADLFDQDVAEHPVSPPGEPVVRRTRSEPEPDPEPADDPPEDFLEDTPEFLEETPEHDRLWFEQKPPKDFDFD